MMNTMYELLIGGAVQLFQAFCTWCAAAWTLLRASDALSLRLFCVIALLFVDLSCAFFAASSAEKKGRQPFPHFLISLLIPVLYPLAVLLIMKKNYGAEIAAIKAEPEAPKLKPRESAGLQFVPANPADPEKSAGVCDVILDDSAALDQTCLTRIARNSDGTAAGPYLLSLNDGRSIEISRILNPMAQVVLVELMPNSEGKQETLRLPYAKLSGIRKMNEENNQN